MEVRKNIDEDGARADEQEREREEEEPGNDDPSRPNRRREAARIRGPCPSEGVVPVRSSVNSCEMYR